MAQNSKLIDILQQNIDKTDQTQRIIGMLAVLLDEKFDQLNEKMGEVNMELEDHAKRIEQVDQHSNCPFNINKRVDMLEEAMRPMIFIDKYPKLTMLIVIGFLALTGLGVEKVITTFSQFFK